MPKYETSIYKCLALFAILLVVIVITPIKLQLNNIELISEHGFVSLKINHVNISMDGQLLIPDNLKEGNSDVIDSLSDTSGRVNSYFADSISYDLCNRVNRIGSLDISYNINGYINQIGPTSISYNAYNRVSSIGGKVLND